MPGKVVFIVNPKSANGSTARQWPEIYTAVRGRLGPVACHLTGAPGEATAITREAVASGADVVVCVGGDGTFNEVVNGLRGPDGQVVQGVILALVPRGTGCDFTRSAPVPKGLSEVLDGILSLRTCVVDIGEVSFRDHAGRPAKRYFHNVVSFGLGGEVDARVNRRTKFFGGFLSFVWATLASVMSYQVKRISLTVDGREQGEIACWNVAVANGQYHGGGMWVAPGAKTDDGLFQITLIGGLSLVRVLWNLPNLYNGKIYAVRDVQRFLGRQVEVRSQQRVLIDLDGEQPGEVPATVRIIPSAIRVISA